MATNGPELDPQRRNVIVEILLPAPVNIAPFQIRHIMPEEETLEQQHRQTARQQPDEQRYQHQWADSWA